MNSKKQYFCWKTKWFWTHPVWLIVLTLFFVQGWTGFEYIFHRTLTSSQIIFGSGIVTLVFGFISSSSMVAIDLSRGYHIRR